MSDAVQRHPWSAPEPAAIVLQPGVAARCASEARERRLTMTACLFDAAEQCWHAARCTLGDERDRLNRAGEAAWLAASSRLMEMLR